MNLTTRNGHLIQALRDYPFDKQIKARMEEIEVPYRVEDDNAGIKSGRATEPKALIDLIKKESDVKLQKMLIQKKSIEEVYSQLSKDEYQLIQDVYVNERRTAEGASRKYFNRSKDFAYRNVINPFFEQLDAKIWANSLKLSEKFTVNLV